MTHIDELTRAKNLLAQYRTVAEHAQKIVTRTGATNQEERDLVQLIDVLRPKAREVLGK